MSVASHEVWDGRRLLCRGAGVLALVLLAACGGEQRESAGAGTEGAAVTDTAPAPSADTATTPAGDTTARKPADTAAADTAAAVGARDTAAKQPGAQLPGAQPSTPVKPAAPTPTETAAKPAQPNAPAQQPAADTSAPADTAATAQADTGSGQTETAAAPLRDEYHQAPKDTVDQATYDGWKQYNLNCARCHGEDVLGSTIAPHLIMSLKPDGPINSQEKFVEVVCAGRPEKGMPSWCALGMDPAKINQIYAYVKGRSEAKIGPGRPSVKPEG
jgi:hypothetical protein